MSEQNVSPPERPSLRIAELSIQNFRTFRERTVIPFSSESGAPDAVATFHGDNASGKSNAIAALHFFLRTVRFLVQKSEASIVGRWDRPETMPIGVYEVRYRDRPSDANGPTELSARFADERLGTLKVSVLPMGSEFRLVWEGSVPATRRLTGAYRSWLETPLGPESRPMAIINANRRASWVVERAKVRRKPSAETMQPALAEDLLAASVSRDPKRRAQWRSFQDALAAVPAFAGKEVTINRPQKDGDPELTFEERDKSVLGLEELSSGERQLVVLFAGVLLANAAIVAIEEPELSLDAKSQRLFYDFLARLVQKRRIDQAIIESHVAAFDGPNVIRFQRDPGGTTKVSRDPSETEAQAALTRKAREQDAQRQWVTRDGYTELPEIMRKDLGLMQGGGLWFLKGDRWEAWPDRDVEDMLGGGEPAENDRE